MVERIKYEKSKREDLLKNGRDFRSKFDRFARDFEVKNYAKLLLSSVFIYNMGILSMDNYRLGNSGSYNYNIEDMGFRCLWRLYDDGQIWQLHNHE